MLLLKPVNVLSKMYLDLSPLELKFLRDISKYLEIYLFSINF